MGYDMRGRKKSYEANATNLSKMLKCVRKSKIRNAEICE